MGGKPKCKSLMSWRSFHIFIMVWFVLNIIVRLPNEVCVWVLLSTMYYLGWQYSTIIYHATVAYINYCLTKQGLNEIYVDAATDDDDDDDEKDRSLKNMDETIVEKY